MPKNYMVKGQYVFDLSTDTSNYVVQGNDLITTKQTLKLLNSAKVVRAIIMQIQPNDDDFKTYRITIPELANMFGVSPNNLYRDVQAIRTDIKNNWIEFSSQDEQSTIEMAWFDVISYHREQGFLVKLNPYLKPYLLKLQGQYTQYQLEDVLRMKSVFALRLYELLIEKSNGTMRGKKGASVTFSLNELRTYLNCENKFLKISQFREKVLDKACSEIERCTFYSVNYELRKGTEGKAFEWVDFDVISLVYKPN